MQTILFFRIAFLLGALVACGACATGGRRSEAASGGHDQDARVVEAGPYRMHYGMEGGEEFLLVTRGKETIFTKKGNAVAFFAQGRPFSNFATLDQDGIVAAYMIHIRDAEGRDAYTLVDENVDGIFDRKIDYGTKMIYDWAGDRWVTRPGK